MLLREAIKLAFLRATSLKTKIKIIISNLVNVVTIFSINFTIYLINKNEFSWKTQNCLGDPKHLNGRVYFISVTQDVGPVGFQTLHNSNTHLYSCVEGGDAPTKAGKTFNI